MLCIQKMFDQMNEELDGAEEYICLALKCKDSDKSMSELYASMSRAELDHFNRIHEQVVRVQRGETNLAAVSQDFYDWLCDKATIKAAKVKYLIESYK